MGQNEAEVRDRAHWEAVEEASELLHEERFREALARLREVLRADPTNPYAFHLAGIALFECGELEPARDAHRACLKLAPRHLGARVSLCHVLRMLGDLRGAIREGLQALSQAPGDAECLHALGLAHYARGDTAAATKYLRAMLDAQPEFETAIEVRAMLDALESSPR